MAVSTREGKHNIDQPMPHGLDIETIKDNKVTDASRENENVTE